MEPYRPTARAAWLALAVTVAAVLPVAGVFSLPTAVFVTVLVSLGVLFVAFYALLTWRGSHAWNVDELKITIEYKNRAGSLVEIRREETIFPNRSGVGAARVRLGIGAGPDQLDHDWSVAGVQGRALWRSGPECKPERTFFRQGAGQWLYIHHPSPEGKFPYPGLIGLLRPRYLPRRYYHITVNGKTTYADCFGADEEYYELRLDDLPETPWIRKVSFTLILPDDWGDSPVKLYRMSGTRLSESGVAKKHKGVENSGYTTFTAETTDCSHEVLRLDWRRAVGKGESY